MTTDYGYVLPDVIDPPETVCFQVHVPKNLYHMAAFFGQMWELTRWYNWAKDDAHTAIEVAEVWKRIYTQIRQSTCESPSTALDVIEDGMNTRIVCDGGKTYFEVQVCACPDTWLRLANADQLTNGTQPGAGSPQPPPGGGTQQYCSKLDANGKFLIPTVISTGDTITIDSASGAGQDGPLDFWRCPDGSTFFAGACVGSGAPVSGDPVPSSNHMSLIIGIGSTFYAATIGTPFTVPSGITNQQAFIQVNDDDLGDNSGSYNICVTVKNNSVGTWSHDFDFTVSDGGFTSIVGGSSDAATWVPGQGWVYSVFAVANAFYLKRAVASTNFGSANFDAIFTSTRTGGGYELNFSGLNSWPSLAPGSGHFSAVLGASFTEGSIYCNGCGVSAGGTVTVTHAHFEGDGTDPF
jgi:hypothetical protein